MNTNERLASHVVTTTFADLPREVIEIAKKDVFDTLGVAIAASGEAGGKELMEMMGPMGGKPESTIIGYGTKLPVHVAENPLDCVAVGTGKCLDLGMVSNFRSNRAAR